jgi:hypothetical protein
LCFVRGITQLPDPRFAFGFFAFGRKEMQFV